MEYIKHSDEEIRKFFDDYHVWANSLSTVNEVERPTLGDRMSDHNADILGVDFTENDLSNLNMHTILIRKSNFSNCDLSTCYLRSADFFDCNMNNALISGSLFDSNSLLRSNIKGLKVNLSQLSFDFREITVIQDTKKEK